MQENSPAPLVLYHFLFIFLASILLLGWLIWPFVSIIVLSCLLVSIFRPIYLWLSARLTPNFASLLTCFLVLLLVFVPLFFFVTALAQEALAIIEWGRRAGVDLALRLREFQQSPLFAHIHETGVLLNLDMRPESIGRMLTELVRTVGIFLYNQATAWIANIVLFIFGFILMIITVFFLFIEHERLLNYLIKLSPLPEAQGRLLLDKFDEIIGAVLIVNGICAIIQGVLGGLVFFFFALGPPVLWGAIMAILAFLPIVGTGLVLVPAAIVLGIQGNLFGALSLIIIYVVSVAAIEYFLKPKLVGDWAKMHIFLVFFGIIAGLTVFGILGIIYGPLIVTAFLTLADIYLNHYERYVKMTKQTESGATNKAKMEGLP